MISLSPTSISFTNKLVLLVIFLAINQQVTVVVQGTPASIHTTKYQHLSDLTYTSPLRLNGDEQYAWLSTLEGYTVIQDIETKNWVYAIQNKTSPGGKLVSSNIKVTEDEDSDELLLLQQQGIEKYLMPNNDINNEELQATSQEEFNEEFNNEEFEEGYSESDSIRRMLSGAANVHQNCANHDATATEPCYFKQLALLVRFEEHKDRKLPDPEEIDILFNHNGPTGHSTASTGSIADVYRLNSFDTFVLDTHVTPWIDVPCSEQYASQGQNGFNFKETRECWAMALQKYAESLTGHGLEMFDQDSDGYLDGLVIVHSGAAAEDNDVDCEHPQATFQNRIWSHAVPKASNFEFLSENNIDLDGMKVGRFYVFSGIHKSCPPGGPNTQWNTGRISVGVHEAGHFLGLPDLYGKPGKDNGIGNWGFMGNMYGWDTSQNWPGLMNGYCRHLLGWLQVIDIEYSQEITITASCDSDQIYRIKHRMASDDVGGEEYLLLENRYACGHDIKLLHGGKDRQGVAIWYVDHTMLLGKEGKRDKIRYNTNIVPSGSSEWPQRHSRLSLCQGDGNFDLENNNNRGDEFDMFRKEPVQNNRYSAYKMSNNGVFMNDDGISTKPYPNTNSIAHGDERDTGITIEVLNQPSYYMRVKITLIDANGNEVLPPQPATLPPTPEPTDSPVTPRPTGLPTPLPTNAPTPLPTDLPTPIPTSLPTNSPTPLPEGATSPPTPPPSPVPPTVPPTALPTTSPTPEPTRLPTSTPTMPPTPEPTQPPTFGGLNTGNTGSGASLAGSSGGSPGNSGSTPAAENSAGSTPAAADGSSFTCDNHYDDTFEFKGHGSDPKIVKIRRCSFINPTKRDPAEFCELNNLLTGSPIFNLCQRECNYKTGCPPPPPPPGS